MNDEELNRRFAELKAAIERNKPGSSDSGIFIIALLLLFLSGCFKGCGY